MESSSSIPSLLDLYDAEIARLSEAHAKTLFESATKQNALLLAATADAEKLRQRAEDAENYNSRLEKSCAGLMSAMKESSQKHDSLLDLIESKSVLISNIQTKYFETEKALQKATEQVAANELKSQTDLQTLTKTFEKKALDAKALSASLADKALLSLTNELSEVRSAREREALEFSVIRRKYDSLMTLINAEREKKAAALAVSAAMSAAVGSAKSVSFAGHGSSPAPLVKAQQQQQQQLLTMTKRQLPLPPPPPQSEIFRPGDFFDDEDVSSPPNKAVPLKKLKRGGS